mgnify:CR=1 FL=1
MAQNNAYDDISQLDLEAPAQIDWENIDTGSDYHVPPVPIDASGKKIEFTIGPLPRPKFKADKNKQLMAVFENVAIQGEAHKLSFYNVSTTLFPTRDKKGTRNVSAAAILFLACGLRMDPQSSEQYQSAFLACEGRTFKATGDWRGYAKSTDETIAGYKNFPQDPADPTRKLPVVPKGATYTDKLGVKKVLRAEVLFAGFDIRPVVPE